MPILRVFPRKTNATPIDDYTAIGSPGLYLKHGYTITSRSCHNHCWVHPLQLWISRSTLAVLETLAQAKFSTASGSEEDVVGTFDILTGQENINEAIQELPYITLSAQTNVSALLMSLSTSLDMKEQLSKIAHVMNTKVYDTMIRRCNTISVSQSDRKSIFDYPKIISAYI